ncbi:NAD-dependent epimerase/dehydratase family protein [Paenibacillus sp. FSL R7-0345]|uniref:NAD-dependent epimerase/dehydratase family protein n=1 Tax=Paenibacillus sp. FSL R7-0345 TaxID=2954535 RepID=UPI003159C11D
MKTNTIYLLTGAAGLLGNSRKAKKLVYVSSTGAIPELPHGEIILEPEILDAEAVVGYYSKTKALATQIVQRAVKEHNLDASIVYPSGICGPNDYAFGPVAHLIMQYCDGKMSVGFEGSFNSVDVRDLAEGVIACSEKGNVHGCKSGYIAAQHASPV